MRHRQQTKLSKPGAKAGILAAWLGQVQPHVIAAGPLGSSLHFVWVEIVDILWYSGSKWGSVPDLGLGAEGHAEDRTYLKLRCWAHIFTGYDDV